MHIKKINNTMPLSDSIDDAGAARITVQDNGDMEAGLADDLSFTSERGTYKGFGEAAAHITRKSCR